MTDWLTPDERADWETLPERPLSLVTYHQLYLHAAEADRRLAEREDVIRELADALRDALRYMPNEPCDSGDCDACQNTCRAMSDADRYRRALARVDALTGGER